MSSWRRSRRTASGTSRSTKGRNGFGRSTYCWAAARIRPQFPPFFTPRKRNRFEPRGRCPDFARLRRAPPSPARPPLALPVPPRARFHRLKTVKGPAEPAARSRGAGGAPPAPPAGWIFLAPGFWSLEGALRTARRPPPNALGTGPSSPPRTVACVCTFAPFPQVHYSLLVIPGSLRSAAAASGVGRVPPGERDPEFHEIMGLNRPPAPPAAGPNRPRRRASCDVWPTQLQGRWRPAGVFPGTEKCAVPSWVSARDTGPSAARK